MSVASLVPLGASWAPPHLSVVSHPWGTQSLGRNCSWHVGRAHLHTPGADPASEAHLVTAFPPLFACSALQSPLCPLSPEGGTCCVKSPGRVWADPGSGSLKFLSSDPEQSDSPDLQVALSSRSPHPGNHPPTPAPAQPQDGEPAAALLAGHPEPAGVVMPAPPPPLLTVLPRAGRCVSVPTPRDTSTTSRQLETPGPSSREVLSVLSLFQERGGCRGAWAQPANKVMVRGCSEPDCPGHCQPESLVGGIRTKERKEHKPTHRAQESKGVPGASGLGR